MAKERFIQSRLLDEETVRAGNELVAMSDELTIDELKDRQGEFTVETPEPSPDESVMDMLTASVRYEQEKEILENMRAAVRKQEALVELLSKNRPTRF